MNISVAFITLPDKAFIHVADFSVMPDVIGEAEGRGFEQQF